MPSKCNKVKNPCKICLETVNNKTGLQCQGACKKWVHFTCLNYTPGKIKDIRQGIIKVTCPCPDCRTTTPKEFRTDEPFSCTNIQCPSNLPRSCIINTCPSNQNGTAHSPTPLLHCEKNTCKKNKTQTTAEAESAPPTADASCPSSSSASSGYAGDMGNRNDGAGQAMIVVEQICNTVGTLTDQINCLMNEMKTLLGEKQSPPKPGGAQPNKTKPCNCPGNPRRS